MEGKFISHAEFGEFTVQVVAWNAQVDERANVHVTGDATETIVIQRRGHYLVLELRQHSMSGFAELFDG